MLQHDFSSLTLLWPIVATLPYRTYTSLVSLGFLGAFGADDLGMAINDDAILFGWIALAFTA